MIDPPAMIDPIGGQTFLCARGKLGAGHEGYRSNKKAKIPHHKIINFDVVACIPCNGTTPPQGNRRRAGKCVVHGRVG